MIYLFLDSDVIIDFYAERDGFSIYAKEIFEYAEIRKRKVRLISTPVALSNVHYLLSKYLDKSLVSRCFEHLLANVEVIGMTGGIVQEAFQLGWSDFEDAMQHQACLAFRKETIVLTRNVKDYKKSILKVMTPKLYVREFIN